MKRITLFIALIGLFVSAAAQQVGVTVTGHVYEASDGSAFENATVAVYSMPDSSVTRGAATGSDGSFTITGLPPGDYQVAVSFVGYGTRSFRVALPAGGQPVDLGDIMLTEATEDAGNVNVVAVRPQIIYRDNKKILKVKEFQDAGATTLAEVLENAPSITLDADGNVLLRGSGNYTLLIDGKPVPGVGINMLRQIPPEMVEDVEIMTNPSAKYDPDGVTGIINLVLKKQTQAGFNGQFTLMAGLNDKYNGDVQLNWRRKKINLFAGVTGTSYSTVIKGDIFRETGAVITDSEVNNKFNQTAKQQSVVGNLGFDYTINDKNSLTISGRFGPQKVKAGLDNLITRTMTDTSLTGNFIFGNDLGVSGWFYMPGITWDRKFAKESRKLQVNIFAGGFNGDLTQTMAEEESDANWNPMGIITSGRKLVNDMSINDLRAKADWEESFEGKGRLEAGYQVRVLDEINDHLVSDWNDLLGRYVYDPALENRFRLNRVINSLYFTWGGDLGKFNYQAGLRGEYTNRLIEQDVTAGDYTYTSFDLFPSANITRKLGEKMQLQLSYSRRINRPGRFNLNPFPQYADNQLIVHGNPDLKPEFIDSYELSFQDQVKIGFLSAEAYYRKVNGLITNIFSPGQDGVITQEFTNANTSHSAGTELMANIQPAAWMRLIVSGNIYYYVLQDDIIPASGDNESLVWTSNATTVFLPTKTTRVTLQGVYNGPTISLQGSTKASYMINAGLRQELFKRKASLALSVRDLFATFRIESELNGDDFGSTVSLKPESRVLTLTFTYNLNNFRQRTTDENMELNFLR